MYAKLLRIGTREAVRHPRVALRLSGSALKYRGAIIAAARAAERASGYGEVIRDAAASPRVRAEAQLALASLAVAGRRAQELGVADAALDNRVAGQLRQARRHAARAMALAGRARRRRRLLRRAAVVAGAGAVGGAAYAGWKLRARPERPG